MDIQTIEEFLSKYDIWFSANRTSFLQKEKKNKKALEEFLVKFGPEKMNNMVIDDYVVGKGGETFCKWVETNLQDFGDIHAKRLNASAKFSIYFDSKSGSYKFGSRFGRTEDVVYNNVKSAVVDIVNASINSDYDVLAKSLLNPLFKNKIFYLYNSSSSLPIYSERDINTLITIFGIKCDSKIDRAFKRKLLFDFYKSLNRDDITPYRFMQFVYNDMGYYPVLRTDDAFQLNESVDSETYSLVDVERLEEIITRPSSSNRSGLVNETPETASQKKIVGRKGEEIVKAYLLSHKDELGLVGKVECACEKNDFKHYDYAYQCSDGRKIYIEVKATKSHNISKINFEMSDKEYEFMNDNNDNYYFFYIDDVFHGKVIKRISAKHIIAKPSKYRIAMNIPD